ncbi:hypothetical protein [Microbacterium sp. 22296]|uniref:hypothetical protein n=1 Tax=Microbacterium sp. 22296 TaxID=3453903 RepID=UPI003F8788A2
MIDADARRPEDDVGVQKHEVVTFEGRGQRHIRQGMTTRPGIIMPAVPFASRADRERAKSVMAALLPTASDDVKS